MQTLSRKTKPLGPRQRLAYLKPLRAALEAVKAKVAEQQAALEKGQKALNATRFTALFRKATGTDTTLGTTADIQTYGLEVKTPKQRRLAKQGLVDGSIKVTVNGGSPGLPALVRRMRLMDGKDIRRLRGIDQRLARLRKEREDLIASAFDRGRAVTPAQLADLVIKRQVVKTSMPSYIDEWAIKRAETALAEGEKHDGTKTCPCSPCAQARQWAAIDKQNKAAAIKRQKAEAARLRKLGTVTFTCPDEDCGHVTEHAQVDEDEAYNQGRYVIQKFVECEACEGTFPLNEVTVQPAPGQQELVAA